jgi:hypothetical protein
MPDKGQTAGAAGEGIETLNRCTVSPLLSSSKSAQYTHTLIVITSFIIGLREYMSIYSSPNKGTEKRHRSGFENRLKHK